MNHDTATQQIKAAWLTVWQAGALASMPVEHQNLRFEQPAGGPWGRLTLLCGDTNPAAVGAINAKLNRTPFALILQVFIPENGGTRAAVQACDAMARLNYQSLPITGATVNFETAGCVGTPSGETGFDQFNVTIRGYFDIRPGEVGALLLNEGGQPLMNDP